MLGGDEGSQADTNERTDALWLISFTVYTYSYIGC